MCKGLEGISTSIIQARKCRRHYGTACNQIFNKKKHPEDLAYICHFSGKKYASKQIRYIIHKGQDMASSSAVHVTHTLRTDFWSNAERVTTVELLGADVDDAPTYQDNVSQVLILTNV